ncbi:hypothetical protein L249_8732 [Ophiocordyceps polyrhachis-furcata BCC 54312]|uniref:NACHT domain-containing protein n=1 Tax=Ophiocordyceps polyrhachis-furcata BCC 54312 TaxID=1330021 RepID=A0A367L6J5_9HYPO|nr:hypothetical protein L249_8732 [Ophiocordyceps polyrhachis-furcata BCC 54312]
MSDPRRYTIGWISAILEEFVAAQGLFDEKHEQRFMQRTNDDNQYALGKIGNHNVVMAVFPIGHSGVAAATMAAKDMVHTFSNVRVCLMVGIGGGVPSAKHDIRLGDVIVSAPSYSPTSGNHGGVVQYSFKETMEKRSFQSVHYLQQPPRALLAALTALQARYMGEGNNIDVMVEKVLEKNPRLRKDYAKPDPSTDKLYSSEDGSLIERRERTKYEDNPAVYNGLIASADAFMENAQVRDLLAKELGVLCFEMEAAGLMNTFPCMVIRGISDYADGRGESSDWRGYAAMAAAAVAKDLLSMLAPRQVEAEESIAEAVGKSLFSNLEIMAGSTNTMMMEIRHAVVDADQQIVLNRLSVVKEASFDSKDEESLCQCLEDTRVELLQKIMGWAREPNSRPILWLQGMAGTGKSTISRSIAQQLHDADMLGASFFFKRGEKDRDNTAHLLTTIAFQLAARRPIIGRHIKSAIEDDNSICDKGLKVQFEKLLRGPLSKAARSMKPLVVVVDALDECEKEETRLVDKVQMILNLFSSLDKSCGLRTFITSRPEWPVNRPFSHIEGRYQTLILQKITDPVIEHDIDIYFNHKLATIRDEYNFNPPGGEKLPPGWPGTKNIQRLVKMATPLFIFASTVCLFVGDGLPLALPEENLQRVLEYETQSREFRLDPTYKPVLDRLLANRTTEDREKIVERFHNIVGSIVVLASPLSVIALSHLLSVDRRIINSQLHTLHSVLSVPSNNSVPVRLLHLSFRDFLVYPRRSCDEPFQVDEELVHSRLAGHCLRVMKETLRRDICGLSLRGLEGSMPGREEVERHIPAEVQYSCLNWMFHLQGSKERAPDHFNSVYVVLQQHLLHWVEALSLLRRFAESISMLMSLKNLVQVRQSAVYSDNK